MVGIICDFVSLILSLIRELIYNQATVFQSAFMQIYRLIFRYFSRGGETQGA